MYKLQVAVRPEHHPHPHAVTHLQSAVRPKLRQHLATLAVADLEQLPLHRHRHLRARAGNFVNVLVVGEHDFTGADSVTVPDAITPDLITALSTACTKEAVNLCDLITVFDSLSRLLNCAYDSIQRLKDEIDELKNAVPPTADAPTMSDVTASSMKATAHATSTGAAITSYEFCISTNPDMSGSTCHTVPASDADNYTFTGLSGYTDYYVQYSATNFAGTATSPIVQQRTLSHAPTADVTPPTPTKPAGFNLEVTNVDTKERDEATVVVCYREKGSDDCPEKESSAYSSECSVPQIVTNGGSASFLQTGLTPSTEYCVIVRVFNEDSTTLYGPYTVTTGEDVTLTVVQTAGDSINLCGDPSVDVTYTATPSDGGSYTYSWSGAPASVSDSVATYTYSSADTYNLTVTATHTTEGYTLTATAETKVVRAGRAVIVGLCENEGIVTVKDVKGSPNSIDWGDGQTGTSVNTTP